MQEQVFAYYVRSVEADTSLAAREEPQPARHFAGQNWNPGPSLELRTSAVYSSARCSGNPSQRLCLSGEPLSADARLGHLTRLCDFAGELAWSPSSSNILDGTFALLLGIRRNAMQQRLRRRCPAGLPQYLARRHRRPAPSRHRRQLVSRLFRQAVRQRRQRRPSASRTGVASVARSSSIADMPSAWSMATGAAGARCTTAVRVPAPMGAPQCGRSAPLVRCAL